MRSQKRAETDQVIQQRKPRISSEKLSSTSLFFGNRVRPRPFTTIPEVFTKPTRQRSEIDDHIYGHLVYNKGASEMLRGKTARLDVGIEKKLTETPASRHTYRLIPNKI